MIRTTLGSDVSERTMDSLSAHYGRGKGISNGINHFQTAIRGTAKGIQDLFIESVKKGDTILALALLRAKPESGGADLFAEHLEAILVHIMESGCTSSLDTVWTLLPMDIKEVLGEKLPYIWWTKGHHVSAVVIAQSDKVPASDAMLFALGIISEYSDWAELIVQKQCARVEVRGNVEMHQQSTS